MELSSEPTRLFDLKLALDLNSSPKARFTALSRQRKQLHQHITPHICASLCYHLDRGHII